MDMNTTNTWQPCSFALLKKLSPRLAQWLIKPERLTRQLKSVTKDYQMTVTQEGLRRATPDELTFFNSAQIWEREISHRSGTNEMIYASVTLSAETYAAYQETFDNLSNRSIGETLFFNNPEVRRSAFEYAKVGDRWARRSTFFWNQHKILVTEYFTENLPAYQNTTPPLNGRQKLKAYFRLMRYHKPLPILLALWPTYWGLWFASNGHPPWKILAIFTAGALLMRAAGCIFNDIADMKADLLVERTKARPLTSGVISKKSAGILGLSLCLLAYLLVLQCNRLTILLAWVGLALTIIYPLLKRVTHLPQLGLGLAFNWGIIMAFSAIQETVPLTAWALYAAAILWTLAYDTIYAWADVQYDKKIGVKSTAVLFGNHIRLAIALLQTAMLSSLLALGIWQQAAWIYYLGLAICAGLFVWQHRTLQPNDIKRCIKAFSDNHWVGLVIFLMVVFR